jgi:hypothetical protein
MDACTVSARMSSRAMLNKLLALEICVQASEWHQLFSSAHRNFSSTTNSFALLHHSNAAVFGAQELTMRHRLYGVSFCCCR